MDGNGFSGYLRTLEDSFVRTGVRRFCVWKVRSTQYSNSSTPVLKDCITTIKFDRLFLPYRMFDLKSAHGQTRNMVPSKNFKLTEAIRMQGNDVNIFVAESDFWNLHFFASTGAIFQATLVKTSSWIRNINLHDICLNSNKNIRLLM